MFQIMDQARAYESKGREIIHLEIGDPDFDSPTVALEACKAALDQGDTHYTSSYGLFELRSLGAMHTERSRGFRPSPEQIVVTAGANVQIYYVSACVVNSGDEVIIFDPSFVSYEGIIRVVGGVTVKVPLHANNGFLPDMAELEAAITNRTRLIIVNSPHNPTGVILPAEIMKSIYDRCSERVVICHSLSKSYAMTGWRIGAVTAPKPLAEKIALLLETTSSCVPPFVQRGAIAALKWGDLEAKNMVEEYRLRRDFLVSGLEGYPWIAPNKPDGTFYLFADISESGLSSEDFSKKMLDQIGVATCPGSFFGNGGEGYVRFCFSSSKLKLERALTLMKNFKIQN